MLSPSCDRSAFAHISELGGPFHARYFAVLEAYLDESERSDLNPRLFSVAGWVGDGPAWRSFESRWDTILHDERFGVPEFKSSDLANRKGSFKDWSDERCAEFLSELLTIIQMTDVIGLTVTLTLNEPEDKWAQARKDADYIVCAAHCIALLVHVAGIRYGAGERVAFVFDERQKGIGEIQEIKKKIKEKFLPPLARMVGPVGSDKSLEILPLQAADLLAYWAYLQRQHDLGRSSGRDGVLLETMSPIVTPKLAICLSLTWEPGFLHESSKIMDPRWDVETRLPEPSLEYFRKPQMPDASRQNVWDANWARLRRLIGGKPDA